MAACQRHQAAAQPTSRVRETQHFAPHAINRKTLVVGVALMLSNACFAGDAAPNRRTIIDSRDNYDPRSLDPALSTDVPTGRAVAYVFDGLTRFTPEARVEPAVAARWDVSPDGSRYVFHIRPGVKFSDGSPLSAKTVVASWQRALDPATEGETQQWEDDESKKGMLMSVPALQLVYIGINTTRGPLKDARVRQAINLAINRKLIVERLISGRGRLAAGVIPPSLGGADTARL